MKKLLAAVTLLTAFVGCQPRSAFADVVLDKYLVDEANITYTKEFTGVNVDQVDNLGVQAVWSPVTVATATFYDGRKSTMTITVTTTTLTNAKLAINGIRLDNGNQWTSVSTTSGTAKAISDAIMANSSLSAVINATWTFTLVGTSTHGVVYATAATTGVNAYELYTSTPFGLRLNGSTTAGTTTFINGLASGISLTNDTITIDSPNPHGITTGLGIWLATQTFTTPGGLLNGTTYYAIRSSAVAIKLATTQNNAIAGTAIDITSEGGGGTFKLYPLSFAGTPSFKLQVSNDDSNWSDLAVSSVTYSGASNTFWDLGTPAYRSIRVRYQAGTAGGLNLKVRGIGRQD